MHENSRSVCLEQHEKLDEKDAGERSSSWSREIPPEFSLRAFIESIRTLAPVIKPYFHHVDEPDQALMVSYHELLFFLSEVECIGYLRRPEKRTFHEKSVTEESRPRCVNTNMPMKMLTWFLKNFPRDER